MYISKCKIAVDFKTMQDILITIEKYTRIVYGKWDDDNLNSLSTCSYIDDRQVYFLVTTKYYGKIKPFGTAVTYSMRKDGEEKYIVDGAEAYSILQKHYKIADLRHQYDIITELGLTEKNSFSCAAGPFMYVNPKYDNSEVNVYAYDLNSAYAYQLMDKIPDTYTMQRWCVVGDNQVGFNDDNQLTLVEKKGIFCKYVFDLIDSPYKEFALKYFNLKRNAKDKATKQRAKSILVNAIGYCQRTNPFFRAYVVHRCNNYVKSLIDENTVMCNTDSIFSLVPRNDLNIGTNIGEWKLEYYNAVMRIKGYNYQINGETPHYRGVCSQWFKKNFNILTDEVPQGGNIYSYNRKKNRLEVVRYEV